MKLSAIFQDQEFLGVVKTSEATEVAQNSGLTDYRQIDDVRVEQRYCAGHEDDANVLYFSTTETIDDLQGGGGNTVIKN